MSVCYVFSELFLHVIDFTKGCRGRDHMVVVFTTTCTYAISATNGVSSNPVQARCTQYIII